ncbi:permease-like cell division protein FtsX [Nonomuraea sp. NPDC055795]
MNSPVEERLRQALSEAGAAIDPETLRPLSPVARRRWAEMRWIGVSWAGSRWLILRAGRRWGAVVAFLAVAGVVTGLVVTAPDGDRNTAVAVERPHGDDAADLAVFLCGKESGMPPCKGKAITAGQREAVRQTLRRAPGVETVVFENQETAFKNFLANSTYSTTLMQAVRVEDMPESFRVKIRDGVDYAPLLTKVKAMPGVAQAIDTGLRRSVEAAGLPEGWPEGRAISIYLCRAGSPAPSCRAETSGSGNPPRTGEEATPQQVKAINGRLSSLPGVASLHFEDQMTAWQAALRLGDLKGKSAEDMNASIRVLLDPGADRRRVLEAIFPLAGVERVVDHRCLMSTSC